MTSASPATGPASRADARRNRALVLAAAQRAFAEHGTAVSLAEIARRAGVGAGTVYRHFPTKTDLFEAVMQQRIERLTARAAACLDAADPGAAFFELCTEVVDFSPRNQAVCDLMTSDDGWPRALVRGAGQRFNRALAAALAQAQRHGAVRPDLTVADVQAIFTGCVAIQKVYGSSGELTRATRLTLEALRPGDSAAVTKSVGATAVRNETSNGTNPDAHRCPICDAPIRSTGLGRPARYCSPACRQKAHRRRTNLRS